MKLLLAAALVLPFAFWSTSATAPVASRPAPEAKQLAVDVVHSTVMFRCMHLNTSWAYGRFDNFAGTILLDGEKSAISIEIDAKTVNTANGMRDEHLRGPDFFDVKQFPKATFKSTKVVPAGDSKFKVDGDLSFHGVTKPVSFEVEKTGASDDPKFGKRTGFHAKFSIKRSDFGVTYMPGGLGDDVELTISLEGTQG